jgi:hypothetical protein
METDLVQHVFICTGTTPDSATKTVASDGATMETLWSVS